MFQKCPICDGRGTVHMPLSATSNMICPTCEGKRILNERTGLPPDYELHKKLREKENIPHNLDPRYPTAIAQEILKSRDNNKKQVEANKEDFKWVPEKIVPRYEPIIVAKDYSTILVTMLWIEVISIPDYVKENISKKIDVLYFIVPDNNIRIIDYRTSSVFKSIKHEILIKSTFDIKPIKMGSEILLIPYFF